jgi:hypothetical protein
MRNMILGGVAFVWGGLVLLRLFLQGGPQGTGPVYWGAFFAMLTAIVLSVGGAYYLINGMVKLSRKDHDGSTPS